MHDANYHSTSRTTIIAILLLCCSLSIVLYWQMSKAKSQTSQSAFTAEFDAFGEVLAKANRPQLFELLESVQLQKSDELPLRLEASRKHIAIAERILEVSPDKLQVDEATALLIDKLHEYEQTLFAEDIELDEEYFELLGDLVESVSHRSELATQKAAAVAKVFIASVKFSKLVPSADRDEISFSELNNAIDAAARLDDEDFYHAKRLIDVINELARKGVDSSPLVKAFRNSYNETKNATITAFVQDASRELARRTYKLETMSPLLLEEVKKVTQFQTRSIENSIEAFLVQPSSNEEDYNKLVSSFVMLAQTSPAIAGKYVDQLDEIFKSKFAPVAARNTFGSLSNAIAGLNKPFPIEKITCRERKKEFSICDDTGLSFLFVVGPNSIDRSEDELVAFQQAFSGMTRQNKMNFLVIFLGEASQRDQWDRLKRLSDVEPNSSAIWLTEESSRQFQNQVAAPWLPSWFLIDRSGILKRLNTSGPLLRSEIVDFVSY